MEFWENLIRFYKDSELLSYFLVPVLIKNEEIKTKRGKRSI